MKFKSVTLFNVRSSNGDLGVNLARRPDALEHNYDESTYFCNEGLGSVLGAPRSEQIKKVRISPLPAVKRKSIKVFLKGQTASSELGSYGLCGDHLECIAKLMGFKREEAQEKANEIRLHGLHLFVTVFD